MPIVSDGDKIFANEFERAVQDLVMLYPGFKPYSGFNESPNFEDRREQMYDGKIDPVTTDDIAQFHGDFINPAAPITEEIPKALGVPELNEAIIKTEKGGKKPPPKDEIGLLIDKLEKIKIPEKPLE